MRIGKLGLAIFIFFIVINLLNVESTYAANHKLESLHINVFINSDGSANIVEKRIADLSEGTENYFVIENLSNSEITDFVVKEDGETFQFINNWDSDASRQDKAYKNGLTETTDGYELIWGIDEYGKHEYIIEYTITNFIKQLDDSQILFWRFVNDKQNIPPENVTIEIETKEALRIEFQDIWGFGFSGQVNFDNGKVVATNNKPLSENDYVTILVKFADGMFKANDYINQSFEEIKDTAFVDSDYDKENSLWKQNFTIKNIAIISLVLLFVFLKLYNPASKLTKKRPKKFKQKYRDEYYRDLPYKGDFLDVYYLLYMMGASNFEKVLTAFILKWINEERIMVGTEEAEIARRRENPAIYFFDKEMEINTPEGKLFHMMVSAAGSNDILEASKFSTWAQSNRSKLITWEKSAINDSIQILEIINHIELQEIRRFLIKREDYETTELGQIFEKHVYQYVNYLHDFSLINEQRAISVKILDQYMIWASLLGLTDVVKKQFRKLYPKYVNETAYSTTTLEFTESFSQRTQSGLSPSSSSSGDGGYTSSGGGGGSFGGGSGGGTR